MIDVQHQIDRARRLNARLTRAQHADLADRLGPVAPPHPEHAAAVADRVKRRCNRHGCDGPGCTKQGHREDVEDCRELLRALGILGDPDTAVRHQEATVRNTRLPLDDPDLHDQVRSMFNAGVSAAEIGASIGRCERVTRQLITRLTLAGLDTAYIRDPAARLAWVAANCPDFVQPAAQPQVTVA